MSILIGIVIHFSSFGAINEKFFSLFFFGRVGETDLLFDLDFFLSSEALN